MSLADLSYSERAFEILSRYLTDFTPEELLECVRNAYDNGSFDNKEVAPLTRLTPDENVLELWHGPTFAFKDMALQLLPHLLVKAKEKQGITDEIMILVATSGDTGKAALEGFCDVEGIRIAVFFPCDGVSNMQKNADGHSARQQCHRRCHKERAILTMRKPALSVFCRYRLQRASCGPRSAPQQRKLH